MGWTGSDYNPRRGCNNGEGGPPDLNTFFTDANANKASRADRNNVVFTDYMANNVPMDYLGYDYEDPPSAGEAASSSNYTILQFAPCYNASTSTKEEAEDCYQQIL